MRFQLSGTWRLGWLAVVLERSSRVGFFDVARMWAPLAVMVDEAELGGKWE
jgi:hypothetical protein